MAYALHLSVHASRATHAMLHQDTITACQPCKTAAQKPLLQSALDQPRYKVLAPLASTHFLEPYCLASVTTPSYSLDLIYSSVLRKCFFGFSRLAEFGSPPVCRFEWMSSIRPLRYFVVT
jgi:hypothetical protein